MENKRDNPKPVQPPDDNVANADESVPFLHGGNPDQDAFADDKALPASPPPDAKPVSLPDLPKDLDSTPIVIDHDAAIHPELKADWGSGLAYMEEFEKQQQAQYPEMISGWGSGLANLEDIERQQAAYPGVVWPVVPWQVRKRIGSFRAYFMTVIYVLKRFGRLGNLMDGPVELSAARAFRRWTVILAVLPYVLTLFPAILLWWLFRKPAESTELPCFLMLLSGIMVVCNVLFIYFQSAIVGWFFCPADVDKALQDRCIAVSRYTVAPLALAGLMVVAVPIMLPFMNFLPPADLAPLAPPGTNPLAIFMALGTMKLSLSEFVQPVITALRICNWVLLAMTLLWLIDVIVAAKSLARRGTFGIVVTGVGVFILWIAAWLAVWMMPSTLAMWAMMFASMV